MFSIVNIARVTLAKLLTFLYTVLSVFGSGIVIDPSLPEAPDDFQPVVRFAVCSDIHLDGDPQQNEAIRFAQLFQKSYAYASSCEYDKLDAVIVCGDMTNNGLPEQYKVFKDVINANIKDETQLLVTMGNHEFIAYRDNDASVGTRVFEEQMERNDDNSYVINGYHFIVCSYAEDGKTFTKKASWLDSEIRAAKKDTGDKPIFVFQHPAPFATCYGSLSWGDVTIPTVLCKYPQVVDFSGHSHYPVNDPRSIWQSNFTALGCGTLSYFETDLDGISGNFPYNTHEAAQFYIVEADAAGNVKIMPYDLITDTFFDNEYYLSGLAKRQYAYTYLRMKTIDKAPVFSDDTVVKTTVNDNGETVLTFTGADDKFVAESYKISVTKNALKVFDDNFSGKYMYLNEEDIYDVNLGVLGKGTYKVSIVAMNAYAELSAPLNYTFTVE